MLDCGVGAAMTPYWKTVLFRLYLTAQVLSIVIGGGTLLVFGVIVVQGRAAARRDFACFDREMATRTVARECTPAVRAAIAREAQVGYPDEVDLAGEDCRAAEEFLAGKAKSRQYEPTFLADVDVEAATEACGIKSSPESQPRSKNAWDGYYGRRDLEFDIGDLVALACWTIGPALGLFIGYRWLGWLLKPPAMP